MAMRAGLIIISAILVGGTAALLGLLWGVNFIGEGGGVEVDFGLGLGGNGVRVGFGGWGRGG